MRILVVDDEIVSRRKMLSLLKAYGSCDSLANGKSTLEAIEKAWAVGAPYALMFLDIDMPMMDGIAVLHEIRAMEVHRCIPQEKRLKIIMTTAHAEKETIVKCLQEGCNDYLLKPVDDEMLAKKIAKHAP